MKTILILALIFMTQFSLASEAAVKTVDTQIAQLQTLVKDATPAHKKQIYQILEKIAGELNSNFSETQLESVLGFYKQFNKVDEKHFYVEMFVDTYQKHKSSFEKVLKKALGEKDQAEFMRKLKLAITESEEGNG